MLIGTGVVTPDVAEWVRAAAIVLVLTLAVVDIIAMALMTTTAAVPAHARADRSRRPIGITAVIMLAIAITAVSTTPIIARGRMVLFASPSTVSATPFDRSVPRQPMSSPYRHAAGDPSESR